MIRWRDFFSDYGLAVFTLFFMSIQFIPFEGFDVSIPKVVFMALTPILLMMRAPFVSKAVALGLLFWIVTVGLSVVQFGTPRMSTFYYTALFLSTFCLFYNLVYCKDVFSAADFLGLIKFIIYAYAVVLVIQQLCYLMGLRYFAPTNMMGGWYYTLFRLNSLAIEPSHAARLLTVLFYAFLKMQEYITGEKVSIRDLYTKYRRISIVTLYTMLAIGSGTAIVGLFILSLYFFNRRSAFTIVLIGGAVFMLIPYLGFESLDRAYNTAMAAMTMDTSEVTRVDSSAGARVNVLINTFKYIDFTDSRTWLGFGIDSYKTPIVTGIADYGLISYIIKLCLFFGCCFTSFFSLETLIFILLFSLNIGNIAYGWACLMILSALKYFYINYVKYPAAVYSHTGF